MPLLVLGLAGLALAFFLLAATIRTIVGTIRTSAQLLGRQLEQHTASTITLRREMSGLRGELREHFERIEGLLKPVYYTAESRVEAQDPERLAAVSKRADLVLESVDHFKEVLVRRDQKRAQEEEDWKRVEGEERARRGREKVPSGAGRPAGAGEPSPS